MRKMASIRKIAAIGPIEGADAIEVATVGGWKVVIKKGEFAVGDLAVYCEIDSWIPNVLAPFLSKGKEPREFNGVKGERLRTVKLRGQLSQGLLLPWTVGGEGDDMTELLGIQKWEMAVPAQLAGQVKGNFPSQIPKTDQERVQNLVAEVTSAIVAGMRFEVTEKLEGSSMTCYLINGEFGVCSRNMDLKRDEGNTFWATAIAEDIEAKMREIGDGFAVQGELIGPGIQGNIYKMSKHEFRVFDVYDVMAGDYMRPDERRGLVQMMGLKHVPVMAARADLYDTLGLKDVEDILKFADGKSVMGDITGPWREGLVFKQADGGMTFKAISNKYLLGEK